MRLKILVRFADCPDRMTLVAEFAERWSTVVASAVKGAIANGGPLPELFVPHPVHNTSLVKDVVEFGLSKSRLRSWADVVDWWKDRPVFHFLGVDIHEMELYLVVDRALRAETLNHSLANYCDPDDYATHTDDWCKLLYHKDAEKSSIVFDRATGNLYLVSNSPTGGRCGAKSSLEHMRTFVDTKSTQVMTGFSFPCSWSISYPLFALGVILRTRRERGADLLPLLEWYFKIWHNAHTIDRPISLTAMLSAERPSEFTNCADLDLDLTKTSA